MKKLFLLGLVVAAMFCLNGISAAAASDTVGLGKYPVQVVAKRIQN